jgi:hypothetical protein
MTKDRYHSWLGREAEILTVVLWPYLHLEIVDIEICGRWIASPPASAKTTTSAALLGATAVVISSGLSLGHCALYLCVAAPKAELVTGD